MGKAKKHVIYTRPSASQPNATRCRDQERAVRDALERSGLDLSEAVMIDEKEAGGAKMSRRK